VLAVLAATSVMFAKGEAFLKVLYPEALMAPSERCKLDRGGWRGFSPLPGRCPRGP